MIFSFLFTAIFIDSTIKFVSTLLEEILSREMPGNDNHEKTHNLSLGSFINQDSVSPGNLEEAILTPRYPHR